MARRWLEPFFIAISGHLAPEPPSRGQGCARESTDLSQVGIRDRQTDACPGRDDTRGILGTIRLTYQSRSEGIANPDVPENEITAEMIEAGIEELTHHYAFEEAASYSEPEATARILS